MPVDKPAVKIIRLVILPDLLANPGRRGYADNMEVVTHFGIINGFRQNARKLLQAQRLCIEAHLGISLQMVESNCLDNHPPLTPGEHVPLFRYAID